MNATAILTPALSASKLLLPTMTLSTLTLPTPLHASRYTVGTEGASDKQESDVDRIVKAAYERLLLIFIIVAALFAIHWIILKSWLTVGIAIRGGAVTWWGIKLVPDVVEKDEAVPRWEQYCAGSVFCFKTLFRIKTQPNPLR